MLTVVTKNSVSRIGSYHSHEHMQLCVSAWHSEIKPNQIWWVFTWVQLIFPILDTVFLVVTQLRREKCKCSERERTVWESGTQIDSQLLLDNKPVNWFQIRMKWLLDMVWGPRHDPIPDIMGWKLLISYIWRQSKENDCGGRPPSIFALLNPAAGDFDDKDEADDELNISSSSKKYGPGSPAFRRKGLLRRQG